MPTNNPETETLPPSKKKAGFFLSLFAICTALFVLLFIYRAVNMYKEVNTVIYCEGFADTSINMSGSNQFWYWLYQKEPQGRCVKKTE
jgi:hypothetical protein